MLSCVVTAHEFHDNRFLLFIDEDEINVHVIMIVQIKYGNFS